MILLIDIDHTLADSAWRDEFKSDWNEYHRRSVADEANLDMVELVNSLHMAGWSIVAVTTRPERWSQLTTEWLVKHGIMVDLILHRANDDFRPSPIVKVDLIVPFLGGKEPVVIAVDDRDDIIAAYRAAGISALQAYPRKQK